MDVVTSHSYAEMVRGTAGNPWESAAWHNSINLW
jgi:hypothetical protein